MVDFLGIKHSLDLSQAMKMFLTSAKLCKLKCLKEIQKCYYIYMTCERKCCSNIGLFWDPEPWQCTPLRVVHFPLFHCLPCCCSDRLNSCASCLSLFSFTTEWSPHPARTSWWTTLRQGPRTTSAYWPSTMMSSPLWQQHAWSAACSSPPSQSTWGVISCSRSSSAGLWSSSSEG